MNTDTKTVNVRTSAHDKFWELCKKERHSGLDQFEILLEAYQN